MVTHSPDGCPDEELKHEPALDAQLFAATDASPAKGVLERDRTAYGSTYGSGKLFR